MSNQTIKTKSWSHVLYDLCKISTVDLKSELAREENHRRREMIVLVLKLREQ
uniref:hypothetical protein n=1 Tax=Streptococcus pluranimalium TaxID=82348 RepID=UPI003F68CF33